MFDSLSDKLLGSLKKLRGQGKISEENVQDAIKVFTV
jgi:signal recognition particle subunit SRP54